MASLADKFARNTKLKGAGRLTDSKRKETYQRYDTGIYALNLAYSGDIFEGPQAGVTAIAGKSQSFKTLYALITCRAYMDQHEDAHLLFYDSEGGAAESYFDTIGIDKDRVIHIPIMNIEDMKFDLGQKLDTIKKEYEETGEYPKFIVMVDSIGNLASKKEVDDALSDNPAGDMGLRAKQLKAFFRIVTPYFVNYHMQMLVINHTYDEIGAIGAPKQIMSGGEGAKYSANNIFIIGKRQIKDGKDVVGWNFVLNVDKSRTIKQKSAIPFEVTYENGIDKYTGLLDIALATGHVIQPKKGYYQRPGVENDKNWRRKQTSTAEFWDPILEDETFRTAVSDMYCLNSSNKGEILNKKMQKMLDDEDSYDNNIMNFDEDTGEVLD